MVKKVLFPGAAFIASVLFVIQCAEIKYDNPIDIEGSNRLQLLQNPAALLDTNPKNGIADYWDHIENFIPRDSIPPVITILNGDTLNIPVGDPDNLVASLLDKIKVTDNSTAPVVILEPQSTVNVFQVNTVPYTIIYSARDSTGNVGYATRYIFVVQVIPDDKTPPVLTIGDTIFYVTINKRFQDPGATAWDNKDGVIPPSRINRSGTVDTTMLGTYTVTYTVSDAAGNTATAVRKVIVKEGGSEIDTENPIITLVGGADTIFVPDNVKMADFIKAYVEPGFDATDNVDGNIKSKVKVSTFTQILGNLWCITYNVTDAAGNSAETVKRLFKTKDSITPTPPIIDLTYPDSIIQLVLPPAGPAKWKEPGYVASDVVDGDLTDSVSVDSSTLVANLSKTGTYTVIYSVTNSVGASAQKLRTVQITDNKIDIEPPVITLKGRNPDTVVVKSAATYTDSGATAMDNKDGDVTANISKSGTVKMTAIGKNTISYSVADIATNVGRASRIVWVVMDTLTTDLMVRYMVPSENPLPNLDSKTYMSYDIDGEGPDLSSITKVDFSWSLINKSLYNFQLSFNKEPWNKPLNSVANNFGTASPAMTLTGTGVPGLDGKYYVTVVNSDFVWVETSGKFAILWHD